MTSLFKDMKDDENGYSAENVPTIDHVVMLVSTILIP